MTMSSPQSSPATRTSPESASSPNRSSHGDARGDARGEDANRESAAEPLPAGALDDGDWRLLRALRASDHEWTARPDLQETPLDELRLHELKRAGYVTDVGARFLWQLTDRGRALLAQRGDGRAGASPPEHSPPDQRRLQKLWPESGDNG